MAKQKPQADEVRADEVPEPREEEQRKDEQEEEEEPERLNHWEAAHRVVKQIDGDTCLSELADDADRLVRESGGKPNDVKAWNAVWEVLQSLQELGMVQLTEDVQVHPLHRLPSAKGQR